ncbi:MAG: sugar phosphate nucleotidyltransferase [Candidatus Odinarchaeia archaeon]
MKAIIPAGGKGTRLRPLTYTTPKPLLPILNEPMLHYIISQISKCDAIDEVIISANKEFRILEERFKSGENYNVKINYVWEKERLGGVGCIKYASKGFKDRFIVILGDNLSEVDLSDLINYHIKKKSDATVVLTYSRKPWLYGVPEINDDNRILDFVEKPKRGTEPSNYISTGIYVFEREVMDLIKEDEFIDHTGEIFPILLNAGKKVYGYIFNGFWIDIGDPKGYMFANRWVMRRFTGDQRSKEIGKKVFIEENVRAFSNTQIEGPAYFSKGSKIDETAKIGPYTVLGADVDIGEHSVISNSIIYSNVKIKSNVVIKNSIIAENCVIDDNVRVFNSIIGANVFVKEGSKIMSGSRIWPKIQLDRESRISGIIRHTYLP